MQFRYTLITGSTEISAFLNDEINLWEILPVLGSFILNSMWKCILCQWLRLNVDEERLFCLRVCH